MITNKELEEFKRLALTQQTFTAYSITKLVSEIERLKELIENQTEIKYYAEELVNNFGTMRSSLAREYLRNILNGLPSTDHESILNIPKGYFVSIEKEEYLFAGERQIQRMNDFMARLIFADDYKPTAEELVKAWTEDDYIHPSNPREKLPELTDEDRKILFNEDDSAIADETYRLSENE